MSGASNAKPASRIMASACAIFGALLFYFISVPWVAGFTTRHPSVGGVWEEWYVAPYYYLRGHSPLAVQDSIDRYDIWCWRKMGFTI